MIALLWLMLVICFTEFVGEKACNFLRWDNCMLITYGNITEKQQQCLMVMKKYPQNCESTSVGLAMDPTAQMSKHLNQLVLFSQERFLSNEHKSVDESCFWLLKTWFTDGLQLCWWCRNKLLPTHTDAYELR